MVLQGEQRGLDGLVLGAESRQRTVHLVPVHHRPGGSSDAHRSPLALASFPRACPMRPGNGSTVQLSSRISPVVRFGARLPFVRPSVRAAPAVRPLSVSVVRIRWRYSYPAPAIVINGFPALSARRPRDVPAAGPAAHRYVGEGGLDGSGSSPSVAESHVS
ncbi:hypothetical protein GCM10018782_50880 [Streptomyces griseoaurantiacus]|nr:hypothetical protein GCM10018782_50880 [Streptomyces griseoaurantiacus]